MDDKTISAYDSEVAAFAAEWEDEQSAPDDLRAAVNDYFSEGVTVDVGCGSGRDTAWLSHQGFQVHGWMLPEVCYAKPKTAPLGGILAGHLT